MNDNKMHILLIIYLVISLIASLFVLKNDFLNISDEFNFKNFTFLLITLLDIFFTLMLFKWKKWAFYGLAITSLITFINNLIEGIGMFFSTLGLCGFLIICFLLLLKKDNKSGYHNLKN